MIFENTYKVAYLESYRESIDQEAAIHDEIEEVMSRACKITSSWSLVPGGGGNATGNPKIEGAVDSLLKLQTCLAEQVIMSGQLRGNIEAAIKSVSDQRQRNILRMRYINGLSLKEISKRTSTDYRWIRELHKRALEQIQLPDTPNISA